MPCSSSMIRMRRGISLFHGLVQGDLSVGYSNVAHVPWNRQRERITIEPRRSLSTVKPTDQTGDHSARKIHGAHLDFLNLEFGQSGFHDPERPSELYTLPVAEHAAERTEGAGAAKLRQFD